MKFTYQTDYKKYWPIVEPMVSESFNFLVNHNKSEDYLDKIISGDLQLWIASDNDEVIGCTITGVEHGLCFIFCVAGSRFNEWAEIMNNAITEFATKNDCKAIESVTRRKGFSRLMPGFVEDGIIYVKLLGAKNG